MSQTDLPGKEDWSLVDRNTNRDNDDELKDKTEQKRDYADKNDRYEQRLCHLKTQPESPNATDAWSHN